MTAPTPKASGSKKSEEYVPAVVLERFEKNEGLIADIKRRVKIFQDTTSLIVIVLFVFVIALGFTLILFFLQSFNSDTASRNQLTEAVRDMEAEIEVRNRASGLGTGF